MDKMEITRLLDGQGRLPALPKRPAMRLAALRWLVTLFAQGRIYTEGEVNALLVDRSATGDYALLRRELCESGLLSRTNTGSRYWRSDFLRGETNYGDVLLRDLRADDTAALMAIHGSIDYYDDITGQPFIVRDAQALIDRSDLPPGGSSEFFGAKMILAADGQPVGYLMTYAGYPQEDALWLGSLFLHEEHQHRGIGQAVVRLVAERASAVGFRRISLGVYTSNTPGLQFWVRQGFCHIDRVKVDEHQRAVLALSKEL